MTFQQLRKLNRYSRKALADKLGVDQKTIVHWEDGSTKSPRADTVLAAAKLFNVSAEAVMEAIKAHKSV